MPPIPNEDPTTVVDPAADPAATAAATAAGDGGSAFAAAAAEPTVVPLPERIPEKYRVQKEDGSLDLEASTAKLADAYGSLEKRLGTGDAPPKTPEDYAPAVPEGVDFDQLKADPLYQSFLKGAHAKGMTNGQVEYVIDQFVQRQGMEADAAALQDLDTFKAAVEPHFADVGGFDAGIKLGLKAVRAVIPDVTAEELASLPNNPIMARVLAAFGKEVGEDTTVREGVANVADWESEVATIQASEAYNQANHPEHKKAVDRLAALYAARYPNPQKLGASAVIKT